MHANVRDDDEICRRLAMLLEGRCEELGPSKAAQKYGFTRQRYYQILADLYQEGAEGLRLLTPGPKSHYPPQNAHLTKPKKRDKKRDGFK